MTSSPDLVCLTYLADVEVLHVGAYPAADGGAAVQAVHRSIAADGAIVAATVGELGLGVRLVANDVGDDDAGRRIVRRLDDANVVHAVRMRPGRPTPQMTVVTDDAGTRTWFVWLADAEADLAEADMGVVDSGRMAYVDCYAVTASSAVRALTDGIRAPLYLNLGGDPLDPNLVRASAGRHVAVVQTSVGDGDEHRAHEVADEVRRALTPDVVIVTAGSRGALAATADGIAWARPPTTVTTGTHGAGAVFSAYFARELLAEAAVPAALETACARASEYCADPRHVHSGADSRRHGGST